MTGDSLSRQWRALALHASLSEAMTHADWDWFLRLGRLAQQQEKQTLDCQRIQLLRAIALDKYQQSTPADDMPDMTPAERAQRIHEILGM